MKRPITPRGYALLRKELLKLKSMRGELALAIEVARGLGDLRENADYEVAKTKSGLTEAKIRDLETKLAQAEIIDPSKVSSFSKVVFGMSCRLQDLDSETERTITIVGEDESDVDTGRLSLTSPFGKALIGKEVGDVVKVHAPGGAKEYEILEMFIDVDLHTSPETQEFLGS
jgi:transcription elongation factor GreA